MEFMKLQFNCLKIPFWLGLISLLLMSSCKPNTADDGTFKIVTTTGMLGDVTKAIVGDKAEVNSLMGPGVDPHLYKATQGDLRLLREADIVIYNGLHLEGKMGEVLEKLGQFPNKQVIAAAEVVDTGNLIVVDENNQIFDPHLWFDVALWTQTIDPILVSIIEFDPENEKFYTTNANNKKETLLTLDGWVQNEISSIPEQQRILITAHDAFAYFGEAYNIRVQGLQGISTIAEAGIKDVTSLVNQLVNEQIKAVFIESSVPKKTIEAVVEGANAKGHTVAIGGTLYSDAMGEAGTPEGTYEGMVKHNINTIVNALQ